MFKFLLTLVVVALIVGVVLAVVEDRSNREKYKPTSALPVAIEQAIAR